MKLLFTLLPFCLLFSCTITKRHFGAGYHIEWKKDLDKKKTGENPQEKLLLEITELKDSSEETEVPELVTVIQENPLEEIKGDSIIGEGCIVPKQKKNHQQEINNLSTQHLDQPIPEVKKKTEPLTWVSMGILIGLGISIGLISIFSSFLYLGTGVFIFGLVLVVFICSLISLIRVCRRPDRYKNKGLTKFIFVLSATCLVAAALYFLFVGAMASMKPMMQGI